MPDDTPQSDLDIFGSSLNMRTDSWLEMFFGNWDYLWMPGNVMLTRDMISFSQPGMSAPEAFEAFQAQDKTGQFTDYGFGSGMQDMSWNVWRNVNEDIYQTFGDLLTSLLGLIAGPKRLYPYFPTQTYHNPFYSFSSYKKPFGAQSYPPWLY